MIGALARALRAAFGARPEPPPPAPPPPPATPLPAPPVAVRADLVGLAHWHSKYPNSVEWRLDRWGLWARRGPSAREGELLRTPGEPATALRALDWFGPEAEAACREFAVPFELALACLCAEAVGGEREREGAVAACRFEPGYSSDDATPHRVSVGPMQTLLSTAREALADPSITAAGLRDAGTSIRAGVAYMARQRTATGFDPPLVGAAYNAGSVRPSAWPGNRWKLHCHPPATGAHVERFCRYFGDAFAVLRASPELAGRAPSFAAALDGAGRTSRGPPGTFPV